MKRINVLQALKQAQITHFIFFFQEWEHTRTNTRLIQMFSNLDYTWIINSNTVYKHGNMLSVSSRVFLVHFINTPPALIVIRSVSMHLLNLERLSKGEGTKKLPWSNLASWQTGLACVFMFSIYSHLNILGAWKDINLMTLRMLWNSAVTLCITWWFPWEKLDGFTPREAEMKLPVPIIIKTIRALSAISQRKR